MRKAALLTALAMFASLLSLPAFAIQCVPYAREASGLQLKGDAWQWWNAAAGVYERGRNPREGGVLVFSRQGNMRHGHVSVVTRVVSNRVVLVDHANWAPVRTRGRGEVTTNVSVIDVSPNNDWSQVRVWYAAIGDYGHRVYRTDGFVWQPGTVHGGKKPAIQQAALTRAGEMFPIAAAVETAKSEVAAPVAVAVSAPVAESPVAAPAASGGVIRAAKAVFRRADADAILFN
jgi:surface antigen